MRPLKEVVSLPVHFQTHDTGGIIAAGVLAAVESGVDAVDAAIESSVAGQISAPMPGLIVQVSVREGQVLRRVMFFWLWRP